MKICYLCKTLHWFKGGIECYTYNMAKYLSKIGCESYVISSSINRKFYLETNNEVNICYTDGDDDLFKGSWIINKMVPIFTLNHSRKVSEKINHLIDQFGFNIVECPDWLSEGIWFSFNKRIPLVVRLHGYMSIANQYVFNYHRNIFSFANKFLLEKRLLANADFITAVSNNYADLISKYWKIDRKKIFTLYNGVDTNMFKPNSVKKSTDKYILFVGLIDWIKGVEFLFQAIPLVLKEFPEMKFLFIGGDTCRIKEHKGSYKNYLLKYLNKSSLNKVSFMEPVPQDKLVDYYRNSLISVFPSLYEALSFSVLEAMACGVSVIATRVGGIPEIITSNKDGILVQPYSCVELANAMISLIKNESLRKELGLAAIDRIKQNFSLAVTAKKTFEAYEEVINKFKRN